MQWFKDLFSEDSSVSMMRFLCLLCVLAACIIGVRAVFMGSDLSSAAVLCSVFLGSGIAGKASQRFIEENGKKTTSLEQNNETK